MGKKIALLGRRSGVVSALVRALQSVGLRTSEASPEWLALNGIQLGVQGAIIRVGGEDGVPTPLIPSFVNEAEERGLPIVLWQDPIYTSADGKRPYLKGCSGRFQVNGLNLVIHDSEPIPEELPQTVVCDGSAACVAAVMHALVGI